MREDEAHLDLRRAHLVDLCIAVGCRTPGSAEHCARTARAAQAVENGEEVVLPSGVRYTDLVRGGGQRGAPGQLMVLNLK